jgi:hypothetical protein
LEAQGKLATANDEQIPLALQEEEDLLNHVTDDEEIGSHAGSVGSDTESTGSGHGSDLESDHESENEDFVPDPAYMDDFIGDDPDDIIRESEDYDDEINAASGDNGVALLDRNPEQINILNIAPGTSDSDLQQCRKFVRDMLYGFVKTNKDMCDAIP